MHVYSCPVIVYIDYVLVYMGKEPWTALEQSRSVRLFLLPLPSTMCAWLC